MAAKLGTFGYGNFELYLVTMATRYRDWLWVPTSFQNKTYNVLIHAQSTLCRSHSSLYKEKTTKKWRNKPLLRYSVKCHTLTLTLALDI